MTFLGESSGLCICANKSCDKQGQRGPVMRHAKDVPKVARLLPRTPVTGPRLSGAPGRWVLDPAVRRRTSC